MLPQKSPEGVGQISQNSQGELYAANFICTLVWYGCTENK